MGAPQGEPRRLRTVGYRKNIPVGSPRPVRRRTGTHVAWFTLEDLGGLIRRHRADDTVSKAIAKILRAEIVVVDLCRHRDYAEAGRVRLLRRDDTGLVGCELRVVLGIVSGLGAASFLGHGAPVREASAMSGTRRKAGLLWPQVDGYRAWLEQRGYTPGTVRNMLKDLGQVGLWLSAEGIELAQLDDARVAAFLFARRETGHRRVPGARGMVPLLTYLREMGLAPAEASSTAPLDLLLVQYRRWMVQERNLAPATVLRYENAARRFLSEQASLDGVFEPAGLTGADVNAFLLRECGRVSAGSAKGRVAELRSILRFFYLQGITPLRLGTAVPPVGGWRLATLPPRMAPETSN